MKKVTIISDGSCLGNPGPGGWAAILRYGSHEKEISGGERQTTNNRMEMTALIEALKLIKEPCVITVFTDSKYLMHAVTEGWLDKWQANDWRTSANKAVKNQELWEELSDLMDRHRLDWRWVKGHSGDRDNERVDELARREAAKIR